MRAHMVEGKAYRFDAAAFRRERARVGASHADIAACVGLTRAAVSAWERGLNEPLPSTVELLVGLLGLRILRRL
jgi:transcriptional regulator with XRE-family HTH domain